MAPNQPRRTQRERSEATTGELLDAGRELFAANGYSGTALEDVAGRAGVTKGALYHHFRGKPELFRAVFEREQRRLMEAVEAGYRRKRDHWEGFHAACRAFFEAALDPGVQRIVLVDAPAVLGWEQMREIEYRYSLSYLKLGIEMAVAQGYIGRRPVDPLAHLLLGALCEGAMMVARSSDAVSSSREVLREIRTLLDGFLVARSDGAGEPAPPRTGSGSRKQAGSARSSRIPAETSDARR